MVVPFSVELSANRMTLPTCHRNRDKKIGRRPEKAVGDKVKKLPKMRLDSLAKFLEYNHENTAFACHRAPSRHHRLQKGRRDNARKINEPDFLQWQSNHRAR